LNTPTVNYQYIPFTVGLDYKPTDDMLLYAKVSVGYRSGGFLQSGNGITNPATASILLHGFAPENLTSYEVGSKLELFNRHLRFNTAVYYSLYNNIQQSINTTVLVGGVIQPLTVTQNVGAATIYGAEFEANAVFGPFDLHGTLGFTEPRYTSGPLYTHPATEFINVARTTFSLGGQYTRDVSVGRLALEMDYDYQSEVYFVVPAILNPATVAASRQPGYGLLNGKLTLDLQNSPLSLSVWARNITGVNYITRSSDFSATPIAALAGTIGDPRTFGISATYRF
jgi:iron complex outermembrane recepter protein